MRWSLRLGTILGIKIYVHASFLLIFAFIYFAQLTTRQTVTARSFISESVLMLGVFFCVLLHEFGHAMAARQFGIRTRDIILLPIGGVARLEKLPEKPLQELWVAIAGPLVNVVIAAMLIPINAALIVKTSLDQVAGVVITNFWFQLLMMNVMLVLFNLIPAFPMDGGRVLRALLALIMPYEKATLVAVRIGQLFAVVGGIVAYFINPFLALTSLFVFMGAEQELQLLRFRNLFSGVPVYKTMLTEFRVVTPLNSLGQIAELLQSGAQRDFPVLDRGQLVGHLSHDDILEGLRATGPDARVADVMRTQYFMVDSFDLLEVIIPRMQSLQCTSLPVVHENRLVGLLTRANIEEYQVLQASSRNR